MKLSKQQKNERNAEIIKYFKIPSINYLFKKNVKQISIPFIIGLVFFTCLRIKENLFTIIMTNQQ